MKPSMRVFVGCLLPCIAVGGLAAQDKLKETPFYPLQVGNTWHYRAGDNRFTVLVAWHEKVGDTLCALLETRRDGKVVGSEHLAVGDDGVYRHDLSRMGKALVQQTLKPPMLVLRLPPSKGDSWKVDSKGDGQSFRGSFQLGEQEITVPAGTYKTFRVASQDLEVNSLKPRITTFFAEGVGMVKQIIEVDDTKLEIELEKFSIARRP
jgi:hypothetical protein